MSSLSRFIDAQDAPRSGLEVALAELRAGQKHSHWIWYIFPQLRGLGSSPMAEFYGLDGVSEAEAYLANTLLRGRLLAAVSTAAERTHAGVPVTSLMGADIDAMKLVSSMTLFEAVARRVRTGEAAGECGRLAAAAEELLNAAGREGYGRCAFTQRCLAEAGYVGS